MNKTRVLYLSPWKRDFHHSTRYHTESQILIPLMYMPQKYWSENTLFEIASAVGTPITVDVPTQYRSFGYYAMILVDTDLSKHLMR